jgi:hypothetical protein
MEILFQEKKSINMINRNFIAMAAAVAAVRVAYAERAWRAYG